MDTDHNPPMNPQVWGDLDKVGIPQLSDQELDLFRELIYQECGIHLKDGKRSMMSARLFKRVRALGMESYQQYYDHVRRTEKGMKEIISMIDVITTNKTDFFREKAHFDLLVEKILPWLTQTRRFRNTQRVRFWSAGCSTGPEPYTMAMVLEEYFKNRPGSYSILGTDISTKVLTLARQGIYPAEMVEPVPMEMRRQYLMAGKGERQGFYRVVPELRKRITLGRLNFMDPDYNITEEMDVVFCRNVIIYFDWETKVQVIKKLINQLTPGGFFFIGHSETLNGVDVDVEKVASTVFRKPEKK